MKIEPQHQHHLMSPSVGEGLASEHRYEDGQTQPPMPEEVHSDPDVTVVEQAVVHQKPEKATLRHRLRRLGSLLLRRTAEPPVLHEAIDDEYTDVMSSPQPEEFEAPRQLTIAEKFEISHYVKESPLFVEQVADNSRTNLFSYNPTRNGIASDNEQASMTEHDGLVGLNDFLGTVHDFAETSDDEDADYYKGLADAMRRMLTFIGEKEYTEAAQGLGEAWKEYLRKNPENILCVPSGITDIKSVRKSDVYLFERILSTFSDEELGQFQGRIKTSVNELIEDPANVKVVLLDDWSVSGAQMQAAYKAIRKNPNLSKYADRVEANFIAATPSRLSLGIDIRDWTDPTAPDEYLPVRAYYRTHNASATTKNGAHLTGTHSSVDYDFEVELHKMSKWVSALSGERLEMPPLTHIVRSYHTGEPLITIDENGAFHRQ